ncbi:MULTISPECIES: hypothetical protein [unclassified Nonomuraea]|uniref:hypothetical protein n=1 Tax=unclassified Nonomuraea TaxID=2593643 RepID=UPI00340C5EE6
MLENRTLVRTVLVSTLALLLSLGTAGVSNAASAGKSGVFACPQSGQRFQLSGDTTKRVYVVGPGPAAYAVPDETVYFHLWNTWDGISSWPRDTVSSCFGGARMWSNAYLVRKDGTNAVYIYDSWAGAFRWIPDEATFNKYAFAWNKVVVVTYSLSPVGGFWS